MVVYNLDFGCVSFGPHEAEAVLVIDADAVLPFAIAFESFQSIPRECQIGKHFCPIKCGELTPGRALEALIFFREFVIEELFGFGISKRADQAFSV
jgi:hypothetical protein